MIIRLRRSVFFLVCILLLSAGCGKREEDTRTVLAVSVEPQRELLQAIVGDDYRIVTILPPAGDIESFEPSVQTMSDLQKALVWFKVGNLPFERQLEPKLRENFPKLRIAGTTGGVIPVEGTHGHDEDPHVWSSVGNARLMADAMRTEMAALIPEKADVFNSNHANADSRLQALDDSIRALLKGSEERTFAIWHPSLSYFARDYGLRQIALETDGKETTPRQLRERLDSLRRAGVEVIFYERAHGSAQAETAARQLGLRSVEISLNDSLWRQSLINAARAISGN